MSINNAGQIVVQGTVNGGYDEHTWLFTPALPGDANGDGKVDINDLSRVLTNYDQSTGMSWSTGDFNGDGKVDINDLSVVLTNYDKTSGSSAAGIAPVPEPAGFAMLAAVLLPAACAVAGRARRLALLECGG